MPAMSWSTVWFNRI